MLRNLAFHHLALAPTNRCHIDGDGTGNRAIAPTVARQVCDFRARDLILAWHAGDVWAGAANPAVIYDQEAGGQDWTFQHDDAEIAVTLKGRLRVSAAEGVRAAVLANAGIAIASEWMFAPEIKDGTVTIVLQDWTLPQIDLWAIFPAGRTTAKARIFTQFVQELMRVPSGTAGSGRS